MYRRIHVAVDGSETSLLALDHALALAKDQQARVRLVHAIESVQQLVAFSGGYPFDAGELLDSLRQEGQQILARARERAEAAGVKCETALVETGEASATRAATLLVQDAKSWDADLMVLGTHGRRGFDRVLVGSVAESVVRIATLPVLLVRAR